MEPQANEAVVAPGEGDRSALDVAALVLRFTLGVIYLGHGLQKLGWFKSAGYPTSMSTQADLVKSFGYSHTHLMAWLVTLTETISGALLLLGLLTPLAVAGTIGIMFQFIAGLQWSGGLFGNATSGGYELTLVGIGSAAALGFIGAGRYSLDARLPVRLPLRGARAGVGALVLAIVVGMIVLVGFGVGLGWQPPPLP